MAKDNLSNLFAVAGCSVLFVELTVELKKLLIPSMIFILLIYIFLEINFN